ncbi:MAG: ABC-ATPase domain-containing protein [Pseudomonadota bacterium]
MRDHNALAEALAALDGKGYKAYREIKGMYVFPRFTLWIDHVQGDPFAAPSRLRAAVSQPLAGFEPGLYSSRIRRTALEDFIARAFRDAIGRYVRGGRGTGRSGTMAVDAGAQEIIERTAADVDDDRVEVRFTAGLPADGRRCRGADAAAMLLEELPRVVASSLYHDTLDAAAVRAHVEAAEDQDSLRRGLASRGLVAFVAEGAVLPRRSGVSDLPLEGETVPFHAPARLRAVFDLPNRGRVEGMGVPEGVTLIVGGGFHGKSTLLAALERGVYDHVPGDGRELAVTRADAVKIRAEDGRRVEGVDISPFISNLPLGRGTRAFSTDNASGSTSQAANIMEALEAGSRLLLMDEDTSATNFMIRDELMQRLVSKEREPITPFIDQVENMRREHGVSTVVVMGGSGDYFEKADTVIAMDSYVPLVVTEEARRIAESRRDRRIDEAAAGFGALRARAPLAEGIDPHHRGRRRVAAPETGTLVFGDERVDLRQVEQLVDTSQTRAIGEMAAYAAGRGWFDGRASLADVVARLLALVEEQGLEAVSPHGGVDLALPRAHEIAAMLNRLRSLRAAAAERGGGPVSGPKG